MEVPERKPDVLLEIPAQIYFLPAIGHFSKAIFSKHPFLSDSDEDCLYSLELLLYEACSNVIKHAYNKTQKGNLRIKIWFEKEKIVIHVIDFGKGFDPDNIPLPDTNSPPEGGMGVFLIKKLSEKFSYFFSKKEKGNVLHVEVPISKQNS